MSTVLEENKNVQVEAPPVPDLTPQEAHQRSSPSPEGI